MHAAVILLASFAYVTQSQSCFDYNNELLCVQDSGGACSWKDSLCRCTSDVAVDILFGVDASDSVGINGFQFQKVLISNLVSQCMSTDSRIGVIKFSTEVILSPPIQYWQTSEFERYVADHVLWTGGWRNTPELLTTAISEFDRVYNSTRQQIMIIVTDGNPCVPASGGCPQSVCQYAEQIKKAGVRVVIIGVGDAIDMAYMGCITQSDEDFLPVFEFSSARFFSSSLTDSMSGILCPFSKQLKVTEVKAEKKDDATWNNRWTRFVEVWNSGINFMLNDIAMAGLIEMTYATGPAVEVAQGQYVVFYDASDAPTPSQPSCHLCSDQCTLTSCTNAGLSTYTGSCFCENAIYVACSNEADGISACSTNAASTGAVDACSICVFQDTGVSRTSWDITISDSSMVIDSVVYDATTWMETDDGYSYELIAKGFDNDVGDNWAQSSRCSDCTKITWNVETYELIAKGFDNDVVDNWAQSCSVLGTPGADPASDCTASCTSDGCGSGVYSSCSTAGVCDCGGTTYPQCSSPSSCTKCLPVPSIDDCNVTWINNGSGSYAQYEWTGVDRDSSTQYLLSYYVNGSDTQTVSTVVTNSPIYVLTNFGTSNHSYGGYVQTYLEVTYMSNSNEVLNAYMSEKTLCNVYTESITKSPTSAPTDQPSAATSAPTAATSGPTATDLTTASPTNDDVTGSSVAIRIEWSFVSLFVVSLFYFVAV
eukprot:CAMPEP_0197074786 /NCGR_PEP_ID=MMETSP1384-20130603/211281_1 /TAXON_ID=29189 /ORGANISM="Ammonia sp." /LENGTH=708 /DNA_ID=CAMNT_0042513627 /DNA_START=50 /DNA_END=2177 /DNA_ORIENTATION=+